MTSTNAELKSNETVSEEDYHYVIDDAEPNTEYTIEIFAVSTGYQAESMIGSVFANLMKGNLVINAI